MANYSKTRLESIFKSWEGHCFYCEKQLVFKNYAQAGRRGNWEVAHVHAKARGGSNSQINLAPSCIKCNRDAGPRVSVIDNTKKHFNRSAWPTVALLGIFATIVGSIKLIQVYVNNQNRNDGL